MPLRKNFRSGRSLQSLFHFVSQRIYAATLHAGFRKLRCLEFYYTLFLRELLPNSFGIVKHKFLFCQFEYISDSYTFTIKPLIFSCLCGDGLQICLIRCGKYLHIFIILNSKYLRIWDLKLIFLVLYYFQSFY